MMLPLMLAVLLGLAALLVVLGPLFTTNIPAAPSDATATTLAERERAAKAALHDVEFDYQLGNLAEDDYRGLRERYMRRALAALKGRYDREKALDDAIEAQVRALRARDSEPNGNGHATSATPGDAKPRASSNGHTLPSTPSKRANKPNKPNKPNKRGGPGKNWRRFT